MVTPEEMQAIRDQQAKDAAERQAMIDNFGTVAKPPAVKKKTSKKKR
jgi:hypothetical protein